MSNSIGNRPIAVEFNPKQTTWQFFRTFLESASQVCDRKFVVRHLVGVTLELLYGCNERWQRSSEQSTRIESGEYYVGDTIFLATDFAKIEDLDYFEQHLNVDSRVYLLVPEDIVEGAKVTLAASANGQQIEIRSLESFLSCAIEVSTKFRVDLVTKRLNELAERFNQRMKKIGSGLTIELNTSPREPERRAIAQPEFSC